MRTNAIVATATILMAMLTAAGLSIHDHGKKEGFSVAVRTCPDTQGQDKLLATHQMTDGTTICSYATSGTGYGRAKTSRKAT